MLSAVLRQMRLDKRNKSKFNKRQQIFLQRAFVAIKKKTVQLLLEKLKSEKKICKTEFSEVVALAAGRLLVLV